MASCVEGENSTTTNSTDQSRESSDALPGHINEGILGSFLGILLLANVALIVLIIIFKVLKRKKKTLPLHRENSSGQYVLFIGVTLHALLSMFSLKCVDSAIW